MSSISPKRSVFDVVERWRAIETGSRSTLLIKRARPLAWLHRSDIKGKTEREGFVVAKVSLIMETHLHHHHHHQPIFVQLKDRINI